MLPYPGRSRDPSEGRCPACLRIIITAVPSGIISKGLLMKNRHQDTSTITNPSGWKNFWHKKRASPSSKRTGSNSNTIYVFWLFAVSHWLQLKSSLCNQTAYSRISWLHGGCTAPFPPTRQNPESPVITGLFGIFCATSKPLRSIPILFQLSRASYFRPFCLYIRGVVSMSYSIYPRYPSSRCKKCCKTGERIISSGLLQFVHCNDLIAAHFTVLNKSVLEINVSCAGVFRFV